MGRVWRAADEILDRPVAVKEMHISGVDAEDSRTRRERTLREARATARIDHPNVVRVYDVVDEGEHLWIVMELVAGRSLEQIVAEDGPIGPAEAARVGLGLVDALREVHAGGVLHRDIKPGNVLVETVRRRVVLTDFGIAAIQDTKALTMVGMLVGSPDYMAPERISGRLQGPPSDVWSLGATLCAALDGRSPFSRATTLATLHAVLYEEPRLPPNAGPLTEILGALLEKEPEVRPGLTDVAEALRPIAHPAPTPTLPVLGGMPPRGGPPEWGDPATPTPTPVTAPDPAPAATPVPTPAPRPTPGFVPTPVPRADVPPSPGEPQAEPTPVPAEPATAPEPAREPEAEALPDPDPDPGAASHRHPDPVSGPRPAPGSAAPPFRGAASGATAERAAPARSEDAVGASPAGVPAARPADGRPPTGERSAAPPRPRPPDAPDVPDGTAPAARKPERPPTADAPDEPSDAVPTGTHVLGRGGPRPPAAEAADVPVSLVRPADPRTAAPSSAPPSAPPSGGSARPGVSLNRAHAPTEVRPAHGPGRGAAPAPAPAPAGTPAAGVVPPSGSPPMPPGELPGPAVPAGRPRRGSRGRRAGLLAGAAVAVAGAVVAAVVLADGGSGNGGDDATALGGGPSASVSASASSGPPPSGTTTPSTSPSPSSTVAGTVRPQSLPPGAHREAGGYAWAPPASWRRDVKTGAEVHYTAPDGRQELVAKSALARGDLFESWQTSEQNAHQGTDYRKIRLDRTTFRGYPAVVWEYTFTLQGVPWHARLLGFDAKGTSFQVNTWYQPDVAEQAVKTYHRVRDGFTVL